LTDLYHATAVPLALPEVKHNETLEYPKDPLYVMKPE
jgi:hypothetical protein